MLLVIFVGVALPVVSVVDYIENQFLASHWDKSGSFIAFIRDHWQDIIKDTAISLFILLAIIGGIATIVC